jgi:hypothetical protein
MNKFSRRLFFGILAICLPAVLVQAQKNRPVIKPKSAPVQSATQIVGAKGIVADEKLSLLRVQPSLFANSVQRMRIGREVVITGLKEADGVTFYRVNALPNNTGWVQSEAIATKARRGDDERFARIVQANDGFEQIELAAMFLEFYPKSTLRPPILLLFGDLIEEQARKLSTDATKKLNRREMAASNAPLHSYYLNYVSLDRYRKLGIIFLFNIATKQFHYDGSAWEEIVKKFPTSSEVEEAKKRLDSLKEKLESESVKK